MNGAPPAGPRGTGIPTGADPLSVFRLLEDGAEGAFWLDGGSARTSLLGRGELVEPGRPVLESLRREHEAARGRGGLALVGWLSYDLAAETAGTPVAADPGQASRFLRVTEALAIEPDGRARIVSGHGGGRTGVLDEWAAVAGEGVPDLRVSVPRRPDLRLPDLRLPDPRRPEEPVGVHWCDSDDDYRRMIRRAQDAIALGDVYVLCLTTRARIRAELDPIRTYEALRRINGGPRGGLIRIGDTWLVGSSPEQFLTIGADRWATTSPIKGTRPRSEDPEQDAMLAEGLRRNPKERAENVMIVDLMRNDLSRVCDLGTVEVSRLLEVESHPHVHQLVSTVRGRLRDGADVFDALAACFPAGSMTGAPKRSAILLADALESSPRGLYSGAFGYVAADGSADFSMTIRSLVYRDGVATIGTGGGITALSDPDEELAETRLKARALIEAVERSRGVAGIRPVRARGSSTSPPAAPASLSSR